MEAARASGPPPPLALAAAVAPANGLGSGGGAGQYGVWAYEPESGSRKALKKVRISSSEVLPLPGEVMPEVIFKWIPTLWN